MLQELFQMRYLYPLPYNSIRGYPENNHSGNAIPANSFALDLRQQPAIVSKFSILPMFRYVPLADQTSGKACNFLFKQCSRHFHGITLTTKDTMQATVQFLILVFATTFFTMTTAH